MFYACTYSLNHSFIHLLIHSFIFHSFIRSFMHSSFFHSFAHSFIFHSFLHLSFIQSLIPSSFIHSFAHLFIHLSFIHLLIHSFIFHSFIRSFIHLSFIPSFPHSLIHSLIPSFFPSSPRFVVPQFGRASVVRDERGGRNLGQARRGAIPQPELPRPAQGETQHLHLHPGHDLVLTDRPGHHQPRRTQDGWHRSYQDHMWLRL